MTEKETPVSWSDVHLRDERRRRRIIFLSAFLVVYALLMAVAWAAIYSPLFRIKDIEVAGNENLSSDKIIKLATAGISADSFWKNVLGTRNILVWPSGFSGDSLKFLPELKSLSIQKNYWQRKIKITVEDRKPFGVWCLRQAQTVADNTQTNADNEQIDTENFQRESALSQRSSVSDSCWWFDGDGVIFKKAISVEGNLIVSLNDYSQKNIGLSSKILPDEFVQNIFSIFRVVSASGLNIKEMRLNDLDLQEIEVDTYGGLSADSPKAGPKIYFSLRFPADDALDVLRSLGEKSVFNGSQYVDFRVENRAYYK